MVFSRYESVSLPQTEDGRMIAKMFADDMKNIMMEVTTKETTTSIKVEGRFTGEVSDEFVEKMRKWYGEK